ncbi:hypothetical protein CDAR_600821 [Caerostris darwini]|uniref:Uncharacterized protein n=1 Tax=Caerostris darwini TaxID=1538125 RepID=A0AAV4TSB8_9ARAC|nr:hypothetical protein CDAR_600821 [Caerostris darwini]
MGAERCQKDKQKQRVTAPAKRQRNTAPAEEEVFDTDRKIRTTIKEQHPRRQRERSKEGNKNKKPRGSRYQARPSFLVSRHKPVCKKGRDMRQQS